MVYLPAAASGIIPPLAFNTWIHTSTGLLPNYPTGSTIAFLPNYTSDGHGVAFVGTSSQGEITSGLFKSTDSGRTWSGTAQTNATLSVAVSPNYASDHLMVAGTASAGVAITTDQWATTPTYITGTLPSDSFTVVAFSPDYVHDHQLFVGTRDNGTYMTVDLGTTWKRLGTGGPADNGRITAIVFAPDYATSHTLFVAASAEGSNTINGVYRGVWSSSGPSITWTWSQETNDSRNLAIRALVISPNYPQDHTLYFGTYSAGFYKSTDKGAHWTVVEGTESMYILSLAISPRYAYDRSVFIGLESSGVLRYIDSPTSPSFIPMNNGFNAVVPGSIMTLTFAPGSARVLFAGMWEDANIGGVWQYLFPYQQFIPFLKK
jgi:hypothetical protein